MVIMMMLWSWSCSLQYKFGRVNMDISVANHCEIKEHCVMRNPHSLHTLHTSTEYYKHPDITCLRWIWLKISDGTLAECNSNSTKFSHIVSENEGVDKETRRERERERAGINTNKCGMQWMNRRNLHDQIYQRLPKGRAVWASNQFERVII